MTAVSRTRWRALSHASFSMTVPAMSGTATREMIKATPTRNWVALDDRKALDVYRKDASSGWTVRRSTTTSTSTRKTPKATAKYGTMDSPEKMLLWDSAIVSTVSAAPSTTAPR